MLHFQNIFASYLRLNLRASNRYGVDTIWQTISSCYPELINFLHCPTTVHCVSRSWIQARDERTGWKAVINLSRLRALLCSVCQPGSRLWMKYWLDGAHLPHYTLTQLTDRERERENNKNRPSSTQYLIWKIGKVFSMQSLSISVIITNALL